MKEDTSIVINEVSRFFEQLEQVVFTTKEENTEEYLKKPLNSRGGLLNPYAFKDFENSCIPVHIDMLSNLQAVEDKGRFKYNKDVNYISFLLKVNQITDTSLDIIFFIKVYLNQLIELGKKYEENKISSETIFFIKLEKLLGYDWLKPTLFYDNHLKNEVGSSTTNNQVEDYIKKISNKYGKDNIELYEYKTGDFVIKKGNTSNKIIILKPNNGWYIVFNGYIIYRTLPDSLKIDTNITEEEKSYIYSRLNDLKYNGKWMNEVHGIETENFKVTTQINYNDRETTLRTQELIEYLRENPISVGLFLKNHANSKTYLVLKILQYGILMFNLDDQLIILPRLLKNYYPILDFPISRQKEVYDYLNKMIYRGKHVDKIKGCKTDNFIITTNEDFIENPLLLIKKNYIYAIHPAISNISSFIFRDSNKVEIRHHVSSRVTACGYESLEGNFYSFGPDILIEMDALPDNWRIKNKTRLIVRFFQNNEVRIWLKDQESNHWSEVIPAGKASSLSIKK